MKLFLLFLSTLLTVCVAVDHACYSSTSAACKKDHPNFSTDHCNAVYGKHSIFPSLHIGSYVNEHIDVSYKYLKMSAYYGTYDKNREGFQKFYRQLSDKAWEDAIELIKYSSKRGHNLKAFYFNTTSAFKLDKFEVSEIAGMSNTLDAQKFLAEEAHRIIQSKNSKPIDPEFVSWMEGHFLHQHAQKIREISNHVLDLTRFLSGKAAESLSLTIFDDYLLSTL